MTHSPELARLCVVLVSTRNPLNIGAAARAITNFGFTDLRVVNPYEVAFREARSAVGAAAVLAEAREYVSVAEAVADCALVVGTTAARARQLEQLPKSLVEVAPLICKQLGDSRVALLFGPEKRGLSNDDLSHCHWLLNIPTREGQPSMNLGQAVAVCLYEMVREVPSTTPLKPKSGLSGPPTTSSSATAGDLERITTLLLETLRASGYVNPRAWRATEERIRRMVRRLQLDTGDAALWLGMLRQITWKLGGQNEPSE